MSYLEHRAEPGDRWDLIAYRYYGDATRTGPLLRANRALFGETLSPVPLIIAAGTVVRVPILFPEPIAAEALPPWKRSQA